MDENFKPQILNKDHEIPDILVYSRVCKYTKMSVRKTKCTKILLCS